MNPVNILLVDDKAENLTALEAVLEPLGQKLVRADSGQEALRQVLRTEFAAILLDVQMPLMDGFETARLIRERGPTKGIPIIFITGVAVMNEDLLKGYGTGAVDYMLKPVIPEILRQKVRVFVEIAQLKAEQKRQLEVLEKLNQELRTVLSERQRIELERVSLATEVKTLTGLLPICAGCKKIRDAQGRWRPIETYIREHSAAEFSHGLCPECLPKYFPDDPDDAKNP